VRTSAACRTIKEMVKQTFSRSLPAAIARSFI